MDILDYVNSSDIKQYLHDIDYKCSSIQAAWLVNQSKYKSFDDKQRAWQWIIDNMPDCVIPDNGKHREVQSLHAFLAELIAFREKHKKRIEKGKSPKKKMTDEDWELYEGILELSWYCFPTPFEKGDIVCRCTDNPHNHSHVCAGVFVLEGLTNTEDDIKRFSDHGDTSDMDGYGWFSDYDGTIYREVMSNYMDLELYNGDLRGQERILIAISNYVKGKIGIDLLLQSQRTLIYRDYGDDWMPNWYTDEGLEYAGIGGLSKMSKKEKAKRRKARKKIEKNRMGM